MATITPQGYSGTGSIVPGGSTVTPAPYTPPAPYKPPKQQQEVPQSIIDNAKQNPSTTSPTGKDVFGNPVNTPQEQTQTSAPQTDQQKLADEQAQRQQADADYQAQAQQVHDTILNIQNGTTPLTAGQQAQIDGLKQQFKVMIDQQTLINTGASGLGNIRGYQKGAAEYDPTFQVKTIGAIVSAGQQKISDLNIKMASAVAAMTQSFHDNDIKAVTQAWDTLKDAQEKHAATLEKTIKDTQDAIKDAQKAQKDAQDAVIAAAKVQYDEVTKPIQELKAKVLVQGAPQSVADLVGQATSVDDALTAAGGWLQTADGDLGRYLDYKRQSDATGKTVASYSDWLAADEASKSKQKVNEAYAYAYASAKGKAAGEAAGGVVAPPKPLTEVQAKDFTYAQRGSNSNDIINSLQDKIVNMDALTYTLQKKAETNDISNQYVSNDIRQLRQAERDFATAILRRESGAAISTGEFNTVEAQYFPRPGEDAQTIAQKAALRDTAINSFKANVPDFERRMEQTPGAILNQAEDVATATLTSYKKSHPNQVAEIDQRIQGTEKSLGRPITATEFLQAFPEYK